VLWIDPFFSLVDYRQKFFFLTIFTPALIRVSLQSVGLECWVVATGPRLVEDPLAWHVADDVGCGAK
jgi:hypothetical protein